jgi:hypothetical protein
MRPKMYTTTEYLPLAKQVTTPVTTMETVAVNKPVTIMEDRVVEKQKMVMDKVIVSKNVTVKVGRLSRVCLWGTSTSLSGYFDVLSDWRCECALVERMRDFQVRNLSHQRLRDSSIRPTGAHQRDQARD